MERERMERLLEGLIGLYREGEWGRIWPEVVVSKGFSTEETVVEDLLAMMKAGLLTAEATLYCSNQHAAWVGPYTGPESLPRITCDQCRLEDQEDMDGGVSLMFDYGEAFKRLGAEGHEAPKKSRAPPRRQGSEHRSVERFGGLLMN